MQVQVLQEIILITTGLASFMALLLGINIIRTGRKIPYFRIRQQRVANGWRMIGIACILGALCALTARYAQPLLERIAPPIKSTISTAIATLASTPTVQPSPTVTSPAIEIFGPSPSAGLTLPSDLMITSTLEFSSTIPNPGVPTQTILSRPSQTQTASRTPRATDTLVPTRTKTTRPVLTLAPTFTTTPRPAYGTLAPTFTTTPRPAYLTLAPTFTTTPRPAYLTLRPTWTISPTHFATLAPTRTITPSKTAVFTLTAKNTPQPGPTSTTAATLTLTASMTPITSAMTSFTSWPGLLFSLALISTLMLTQTLKRRQ